MDCTTLNAKGEDNRLNNWKKWIQMRKEFHQQMFKIQKRRPSELLLNSAEDARMKKEIQQLHEYAKIPEVLSNRGKPSFWDFPPASKKFPSLHAIRTKAQDYEVPEVETVGVPTLIQREKDVLTSENRKCSQWFSNDYLRKRHKELDLHRVQSYRPRTENLIVTGNSYKNLQIGQETEIKVENFQTEEERSQEIETSIFGQRSDDQRSTALEIAGATFIVDGSQEIKNHYIFLNYEIGNHDMTCNQIELKNIGGVAVRYYWDRRLPKKILEDIIPKRLPIFGFNFMKNENIVLPDQTNVLTIFFKTNKPGMYKEIWELKTIPNVFEGKIFQGEFFLILCACADVTNFNEFKIVITNRIEEGMKYTIIAEAIAKLWQRTANRVAENKDETSRVSEKDLFEAINAKFGPPGTLPLVYHYDETTVKKLRAMYDSLKTDSDPQVWNYKIEDIENLIHKCKGNKNRNYYKFAFEELMRHIHKTNMIENEDREKYQNIYLLLCAMIDKITDRVYDLRNKFKISFIETYPAVTEEMLLMQEHLYDNNRSRLFFPDITSIAAIKRIQECKVYENMEPPMEALKFVPFDDIEERYKIYQKEKYGIDVDKPKDELVKKKGKDKEEKGKKGKEEKNKKGKDKDDKKETKKKRETIKESISKEESLTKLLSNKVEIIPDNLGENPPNENLIRMYHYSMYISIYCLLCETANEIELLLEHMKINKKISRDVLRRCIELGIPTFPLTDDQRVSQKEFDELLGDMDILSTPTSDMSFTESVLSDIPKSYSNHDDFFFKSISSILDIPREVEMVDAQTETDCEELFPPKTRVGNVQTDADDEEFDLVAQIERQLSATSVQYFKKPTETKAIQVDVLADYIEEEEMMEG